MMSIKTVNALSHYTDWTIGHVHAGTLGWNGFIAFAVIYWLLPRLWRTTLWSRGLATTHFWVGTVGILLYQVSMWVAGITQGLMWRAFEPDGRLTYQEFIETVTRLIPMYEIRFVGGLLYLTGVVLLVVNLFMTIRSAPANYREEPERRAPALQRDDPLPAPALDLAPATYDHLLYRFQAGIRHGFHRWLETLPLTMTVLSIAAISVGSLVEAVPLFLVKSNVPTILSVKPYTPLELAGRGIYLREGCYTCHSQMVRPFRAETERYGEYSKAGEFVYDHPFQWGSKRTGPDLHREGGLRPDLWHVRHMETPALITRGSIMPAFPHLNTDPLDLGDIQARMEALRRVGVPYTDADIEHAEASARAQARSIAAAVETAGGPSGLEEREILALTAYLQRLGTDIRWREGDRDPASGLTVAP
jgi:cytochrome c oxidase cbb3-type subunit I/II